MLNNISAVVASATFITLGTFLLPNTALARGRFSASCKDLNLKYYWEGGPTLEANCKNEAGNWNHSKLRLNDYIANMNGTLVWLKKGNFAATCQPGELRSHGLFVNQPILVVVCRTEGRSGSLPFQTNSFNLDERIANRNGNLTYEP